MDKGASLTEVLGVNPFSIAAAYMKGLKAEPG
jgi:hypothetical protein